MSIHWLKASVRVWRSAPEGGAVPDNVFLARLADLDSDAVFEASPSRGQWQTAIVTLVAIQRQNYPETVEGTEAFEAALSSAFASAATWLELQPDQIFLDLHTKEYKADFFVEAWIDCNQFDVHLPSDLIRACNRHGLPIIVYTND